MVRPLFESLRPAQWVKNAFVLAPLVFAGRLTDGPSVGRGLLALVAFCLAASAVYLWNDLRDREEDRNHPLKRHRPLAAGTLKVPVAVAAVAVLAGVAAVISVDLGLRFGLILAGYLLLNLLYTLWLKHMVILDVMSISMGFVLRVEAGAVASQVEGSRWLFLCTIFLALFLAFSKRRHEITLLVEAAMGDGPGAKDAFAEALAEFVDEGIVKDAVIAQSGQDRKKFWAYREANYEFGRVLPEGSHFDVSIPLTRMADTIELLRERCAAR